MSKSPKPIKVTCPYCQEAAKLVPSAEIYGSFARDYGKFWLCKPCDAYVGVHKNSPRHVPLGRLANAELREWKIKAHAAFDPLWQTGLTTRKKAYKLMSEVLELSEEEAHIGKLDVDQCKRLVKAMELLA